MKEIKDKNWLDMTAGNYFIIPTKIVELIGSNSTILLSFLLRKERYFEDREELTEDGFFYNTINDIEQFTHLSRYKQDYCIERLKEFNLIETDLRGLPAKKYFKINHLELANKFVGNSQTSLSETRKQVCRKLTLTNKAITNNPCICASHNSVLLRKKKFLVKQEEPKRELLKKGIEETLAQNSEERKEKEKEKLSCVITFDMQQIIDYWVSKNLPFHREGTKTYAHAMNNLHSLFKGTLFNGMSDKTKHNRKFSVNEIKTGIDNFVLAGYNLDYQPVNKKFLQSVSFVNFFYTSFPCAREEDKSPFLKYLLKKPERITESKIYAVKDANPQASKIIENWYRKTFVGNRDQSFSLKNKNDIVYSVIELAKFYEENKSKILFESHKRLYNQNDPICFLALQVTRLFDKMLRNEDNLYLILTTSWIKSEKTIKERLPAFLMSESMMK